MESRAGFLLLKEEQKLEKEMNGYMNWICKAGKESHPVLNVKSCTFTISTKEFHFFTKCTLNPELYPHLNYFDNVSFIRVIEDRTLVEGNMYISVSFLSFLSV